MFIPKGLRFLFINIFIILVLTNIILFTDYMKLTNYFNDKYNNQLEIIPKQIYNTFNIYINDGLNINTLINILNNEISNSPCIFSIIYIENNKTKLFLIKENNNLKHLNIDYYYFKKTGNTFDINLSDTQYKKIITPPTTSYKLSEESILLIWLSDDFLQSKLLYLTKNNILLFIVLNGIFSMVLYDIYRKYKNCTLCQKKD